MSILSEIRQLYTPLQPSVNKTTEKVVYEEFLPDPSLQNYIYCYWQLKTTEKLEEAFTYRVVADGCIDIYVELNNPQENFVMGFCRKFTSFELGDTFNYIGIRFLPTMFSQLFNINAKEISNRYEHLSNVLPGFSAFLKNNFDSTHPIDTIITQLNQFLLRQIANASFDHDNRLYEAIKIVYKNFGVVNVADDLNTGFSQRQLRRVFEYYIGDTAKTFSKVVRFQNILKAKPSKQSLQQNKLFYDSGYYDQTHFIKEFKTLYGVTPGKAFGR